MKAICLLIFTAALLATDRGAVADDASKSDLDKLSGTWLTVSLVNDGKTLMDEKTPAKEGPTSKLAYDGNNWMVKVADKTVAKGTYKIDATKTPKQIDVLDNSGQNDKTRLGIYELDADTYKYCIAPAGHSRPTEFTSKSGSGNSLVVSRRMKP